MFSRLFVSLNNLLTRLRRVKVSPENVHLAEEFRKAWIPVRSFSGEGTLTIRMYPGGLSELSNGWKKAFATGAGQTPPLRMAGIIFWLSAAAGIAVMLPVSVATQYSFGWWGPLYLAFAGLIFVQLRRLGQFRFWTALLYPVSLIFFFAIFAQSASQKQQTWKGRTYAD